MADDIAKIAAGLSPAMRTALGLLCDRFVHVDGRSLKALVKRGLATVHGRSFDALLGAYAVCWPTAAGFAVRTHLQAMQEGAYPFPSCSSVCSIPSRAARENRDQCDRQSFLAFRPSHLQSGDGLCL